MAIFGSTINPALGRVDYSPLAQGLAQGGQLAAQGLSNFGTSVAEGIQTFLKKQEEKKKEQEGIEFIKNQFPGIDDKAAKAGLSAAGGPAAFVKFQSEQNALREAAAARNAALEDQRKAAQVAAYLQQGGGNLPSPVNRGAFTSEQYGAGRLAYLQQAQAEANLGKTQAEAAAIRAGKPNKEATGAEKVYQLNLAAWEKKNGPADETQRAKLAVEALRASQPSQPSALEQANAARLVERAKAEEQGMAALKTSIYDSVPKWTDVKDQNRIARELVASGAAVSGPGAEVKLNLMNGVNAVFPGTFDTTPSEVLSANYKNMGLTASAKIKGQGAITNEERKRVDDTIARLGNTPEAAIYIMNFADAVADRELARASYLAALEKQGTELSRGDLTIKFYEDNPLENFMPSMTTPKKSSQSAAMSRVYQTLSGSNEGTSPLANPSATLDRVNGFLKTRGL